ncbi:MAG: hypothetical protein CL677_07050 [Bdellovibrionaceae bacterium]|nr:hypothetical protein [Pseudobdellovibrionaceae bacterium]
MRKTSLTFLMIFMFAAPQAFANPTKDFIRACTYGVLTGTLVGAASLAFEDQPGENLQQVARGASLGLYLGIGLGLYILYGVSDETPEEELLNEIEGDIGYRSPLYIYPIISNNKVDGFAAQVNIATF